MAKVQIVGLADPATYPVAPTMFTQIALVDTLVASELKPPIEQLITVFIDVSIDSVRIVQTPIGTSLGGQILLGAKAVIEGTVNQKMTYVAAAPDQPVHAFEGTIPFSTFIVVPPTVGGIPIVDLLGAIKVTPFIEDVFVNVTSPRSVFKNVILFLNLTIATPLP
ncbi:MAG: DUF3794 domain-containing protein [Firmicutes bacterium]|nr:DUF3794 domain-containing protein [Bacillota bacterium]